MEGRWAHRSGWRGSQVLRDLHALGCWALQGSHGLVVVGHLGHRRGGVRHLQDLEQVRNWTCISGQEPKQLLILMVLLRPFVGITRKFNMIHHQRMLWSQK